MYGYITTATSQSFGTERTGLMLFLVRDVNKGKGEIIVLLLTREMHGTLNVMTGTLWPGHSYTEFF